MQTIDRFQTFQLEYSWDYAFFHSGLKSCDDDTFSWSRTGDVDPGTAFQAGQELTVKFVSDQSEARRGFKIRVRAEARGRLQTKK